MKQLNSRRLAVVIKQWILFLLPAAMLAWLAGCGGTTANVQNPQPPPQSSVSIAFQPQPGGALAVGSAENLTAVVTNDPSNEGVDWSLTCQIPGSCGSLSALHTGSGVPTAYTAPSSITANSLTVQIVALATANQNQNVVAPIVVGSFNSSIKGTFVLQAQGTSANGGPNYQFAGVVVLDGAGGISSGEQTVNFFDPNTGALASKSDSIVASQSSYFAGSDGRGTLTFATGDTDIGGNGIETFAFVLLDNSQALISQMDLGLAATGASAVGTMNLQTSTAAPSGGYAFVVNGTDVVKNLPVAFGGVFNVASPNTISANGSVIDEILSKKVNTTAGALSGTLNAPDSFGAIALHLTAPFGASNKPIPLQFTGYIVDGAHIVLIETDTAAGSTSPFGSTGGIAIGQGTATGTFTGNASFSGTYVFGVPGVDLSNSNTLPATLTSVGVLTADGGGNLSNGFTDTFLQLNTAQGTANNPQTGAQISAAFDGTYSVDTTGTGRATLTFSGFTPDPDHGYQPVFLFYLTGNGNPPLVLEAGDKFYPSLGTGIAYLQTVPLTFSGDYGFSFTQQNGSENDGTAQMNANPETASPSLSGVADVNLGFGANLDQLFTGSFSAPDSNGLFAGTLAANSNAGSAVFSPQISGDFYTIDSSHGLFVETDLITAGAQQNGQVSFGYYAVRTPACDGCP
ncbi:MAG: hypothetical protein WCA92_15545 [Terriglobales bacterium]